jgi:hypothetical protein
VDQLHGHSAVASFADNFKAWLRFEELAEPVAEEGMIVGDEHPDRLSRVGTSLARLDGRVLTV